MPAPIIRAPIPERKLLELPTDIDPDGVAFVEFRPATVAEMRQRAQLFAELRREYTEGAKTVAVVTKWTYEDQQREECKLTMTDCNLAYLNKNGEEVQLFRFTEDKLGRRRIDMTDKEFNDAWGMLSAFLDKDGNPTSIADVLHAKCLEVNRQWDPTFRAGNSE